MFLTNVLFTPSLGFCLVSIGKIDDAGYLSIFGSGKCEFQQPKTGEIIGSIPKSHSLYTVARGGQAAAVMDSSVLKLLVMEFHRQMGHIAPQVAHELVSKGLISGVELIDSDEPVQCDVCIQAKASCKPIPKICTGPQVTSFGEEVHSDIWGPADTETLGHH
ncbi:hypothetical protein BDQ17DRAFT_1253829 [Cyathus striatus]|nr:hypothetical protein BDQ17DRAFT_1253829 [Cyathus striatus]